MVKYYFYGLLCLVSMLFSFQAAQAALPADISAIYVFGDSLSDIGNYRSSNESCFATGGTSAPVTNHQGGAYANKLWINFVNEAYGFLTTPGSPSAPRGNDWAVAGAQTYDVWKQVEAFVAAHGVDSNALYVIWAGPNDIMNRLGPVEKNKPHPVNAPQVIEQGTLQIAAAVALLSAKGAHKFLVIGIPDISLAPGIYLMAKAANQPELPGQMSTLAFEWNKALFGHKFTPGHAPLALVKRQYPKIDIYTWNPTSLFQRVIANPTAYHFIASANGEPNNHTMWCLFHMFSNPDDYIFFNAIHPSAHAHSHIAHSILTEAEEFKLS